MSYSILIVDDQREVQRMLEKALESLGQRFIITGVPSAEEALLEARLSQVDLLVSDIRLPGMSGLELYTRIRVLRPQVSTILLTGVQDEEVLGHAARAGADAFFTKPIDLAEFLDAVVRILGIEARGPFPDIPPEPEEAEPDDPAGSLSDRVAQLRQDLPAEAVLLLDEHGHVLVRAGALETPELETRLLDSLPGVIHAGARVTRLMNGRQTDSVLRFPGEHTGVIFTPLSGAHGLVAAVSNSVLEGADRSIQDSVRAAGEDIAGILSGMGFPSSGEENFETPSLSTDIEEVEDTESSPMDADLEHLLDDAAAAEIQDLADTFWDREDDLSAAGSLSPDSLSYEQAVRLGLAPENDTTE